MEIGLENPFVSIFMPENPGGSKNLLPLAELILHK